MAISLTDKRLIEQIERLAREEQRDPEQVVADAIRRYEDSLLVDTSAHFLRSITGLGTSGQEDVAERAEDILRQELGRSHDVEDSSP